MTLTLKDEYKNIPVHSGSFEFNNSTIPYEVKLEALLSNVPTNNVIYIYTVNHMRTRSTTSTSDITILNSGSTVSAKSPWTTNNPNAVKVTNGVRRTWTIKVPPTVPALTGVTQINANFARDIANPYNFWFKIEFPTPWNKPADLEININLQWDDILSQSE